MKKRLSWMLAAALLVTSAITGCAKTTAPGITEAASGVYYDVDQGVTPDYLISKEENFYDRQAITKLINSLM